MRRAWLLVLAACGGKPAPAVQMPDIAPPRPQVLDVGTLDPLPIGFHYQTTLHRASSEGGQSLVDDQRYAVEVLGITDRQPSSLRFTFDTMTGEAASLASKTYTLTSSAQGVALVRESADGSQTALSDDERTAFSRFYQEGGAFLPGRDALIAQKLDKGVAVTSADLVAGIALISPPSQPATATVTLDGIDDHGAATIEVRAEGTVPQDAGTIDWTVTGTLITDATTLLPASLDVTIDATGAAGGHLESKQTFSYDGG